MPSPYLITQTTSISGTTTGISDAAAFVVVNVVADAWVVSTLANGIALSGDRTYSAIDGLVLGLQSGIVLGAAVTGGVNTGLGNTVIIGEGGSVAGTTNNDGEGILSYARATRIENSGSISGVSAIELWGNGHFIVNEGNVNGGIYGIIGLLITHHSQPS